MVQLGILVLAAAGSESDVVEHRHVREQRVLLEHRVDVAPVGRRARDVVAVEEHRPYDGCSKPAIIRRWSSCRTPMARAARRTPPIRMAKLASWTAVNEPNTLWTWSSVMTSAAASGAGCSFRAAPPLGGGRHSAFPSGQPDVPTPTHFPMSSARRARIPPVPFTRTPRIPSVPPSIGTRRAVPSGGQSGGM